MTCLEFRELAGAYALGALDPDEKTACDEHLRDPAAHHDGCREALEVAREVAGRLALEPAPIRPPPAMWAAIEHAVRSLPLAEGGASSVRPLAPPAQPPRVASSPWPWLAAASLAIGFAWAGLSLRRALGDLDASETRLAAAGKEIETLSAEAAARKACERDLAALREDSAHRAEAVAMLMRPAVRVVPFASQRGTPSGLVATALIDLPSQRGMVMLDGLTPQSDKDYELWVIKGAEKKPAGLVHGGTRLFARIDPALLAGGADAFALSLEPAGGSPTPRGPILLVGALPPT